jgi:hypothetical protein
VSVILDLLALLAVPAIVYILYRKFVAPTPSKEKIAELAYEEGFRDAVRYFGLKRLYEEDRELNQRMTEVFDEAGVPHQFADMLARIKKSEGVNQAGSRAKRT